MRGYTPDGRKTQDHWQYRAIRVLADVTAPLIAIVVLAIGIVAYAVLFITGQLNDE